MMSQSYTHHIRPLAREAHNYAICQWDFPLSLEQCAGPGSWLTVPLPSGGTDPYSRDRSRSARSTSSTQHFCICSTQPGACRIDAIIAFKLGANCSRRTIGLQAVLMRPLDAPPSVLINTTGAVQCAYKVLPSAPRNNAKPTLPHHFPCKLTTFGEGMNSPLCPKAVKKKIKKRKGPIFCLPIRCGDECCDSSFSVMSS